MAPHSNQLCNVRAANDSYYVERDWKVEVTDYERTEPNPSVGAGRGRASVVRGSMRRQRDRSIHIGPADG